MSSTRVGYDAHHDRLYINNGSFAGDHYIYIRRPVWGRLAVALDENDGPVDDIQPDVLIAGIASRFGAMASDPFLAIESLISENNVPFTTDYWVGER